MTRPTGRPRGRPKKPLRRQHGLNRRLEDVRKINRLTVRQFHARLEAAGPLGLGYEAVRKYHSANRTPPLEYLERVNAVFGVRWEWLVTGEEPKFGTDLRHKLEAELRPQLERQAVEAYINSEPWKADGDFLRSIEPGPPPRFREIRAVLRFAENLTECGGVVWTMDERRTVLEAAYRFLRIVDDGFVEAARRAQNPGGPPDADWRDRTAFVCDLGLFLMGSSSSGWYATWSNAVLDLFARRVYGLGERDPESVWDAHAPVADPRAAIEEMYRHFL